MLGDFGEAVAIEAFDLDKAPSGSSGFDAITKDGKTVQIKANRTSSTIGLRGEADLLLVLSILDDATFETLYFGDFKPVRDMCNYSARDNKWTIPTAALRRLSAQV